MKKTIKLSKCCHYPMEDYLDGSYYCWLCDETIPESQVEEVPVRELWAEFGDIPMDPETECIEEPWLTFPAGTHREEIWHWFEGTFGVSVAEDLMGCEDESDDGDMKEGNAMKYNVSFIRNDVCQSNLAIAENALAVWAWYKMYKPEVKILDVSPAKPEDEKPGKPCVQIDTNYLPYLHAADNISLILQHEKSMTCAFYVMDEKYYNNLAYPQLSVDNRGNRLVIGDWYVIVTCSNGYKYYVNVSHDSVITMCAEVFSLIQYK